MPHLRIEIAALDQSDGPQRMTFEATSDEHGLVLGAARSWLLAQLARLCGLPAGGAGLERADVPAAAAGGEELITQTCADARLLVGHGADVERVAEATGIPAEELRPFAVPADLARIRGACAPAAPPAPRVGHAPPVPPADREGRRHAADCAVLAACTVEGGLLADVRARARDASGLTVGAIQTAIDRLEALGRVQRFGSKQARMIHLLTPAERQLVQPAPPVPTPPPSPADRERQALARRQEAAAALERRRMEIRLLLKPILDSGRLFALSALVTEARAGAAAQRLEALEVEEVRVVLTEWVRRGQIGVSTIGLERRYRKRGDVEAIAL